MISLESHFSGDEKANTRLAFSGRYFLLDVSQGVFIMLPTARPSMTILKNTLIIPQVWSKTNPASNNKIPAIIADTVSVRVWESIMNLSY